MADVSATRASFRWVEERPWTFDLEGELVRQGWLEVQIADDWVAAYRIFTREGRALPAELRIFPGRISDLEGDEANPPRTPKRPWMGRWEAERIGDRASVPLPGVTATLIRNVHVGEHLELVLRAGRNLGKALPPGLYHHLVGPFGLRELHRQAVQRTGRRGRPDEYYARVAVLYVAALEVNRRRAIQVLAEWIRMTPQTLRDLVDRARRRGLLTPSPGRGIPGGELTEKALALFAARPPTYVARLSKQAAGRRRAGARKTDSRGRRRKSQRSRSTKRRARKEG